MTNCIRNNIFINENHKCFKINCNSIFNPNQQKTCNVCNWKKCNDNHCRCFMSIETSLVLNDFYLLLCEKNNYSKETIYALKIMLKTYYINCIKDLK